jgi:hypothetical protein
VAFREWISENRGLASAVIGGVVVLLVILIAWQLEGGRPPKHINLQAYYSADDGRTWFSDQAGRTTPFDHDGKQAVACFVFKCDTSGPFVGYLEKDNEAALSTPQPPGSSFSGVLVKRPGAKDWALSYLPEGARIRDIHCPNGSDQKPQPVLP